MRQVSKGSGGAITDWSEMERAIAEMCERASTVSRSVMANVTSYRLVHTTADGTEVVTEVRS